MKVLVVIFFMSTLSTHSVCSQVVQYKITGKVQGEYSGKIYLFFDGDIRKRDSISAEIIDGYYTFTGEKSLPALARIHLGRSSYINDIYLENANTQIDFNNTLFISNNNQDTLNELVVCKTTGSPMERLKSDFETWKKALYNSNIPTEEKREKFFNKLTDFIVENHKSKVSVYLLGKADVLSFHQLLSLSKMIDTSLNETYEMKILKRQLNSLDRARFSNAGMQFFDATLTGSDGNVYSTKSLRKKITLYEFWASWCGPCRAGNPQLLYLYNKYHNKEFEIIGISVDKDSKKWLDAIKKDQLAWPQLLDSFEPGNSIYKYYGLKSIPYNFLVNGEGVIIGTNMSVSEIEDVINETVSATLKDN